MDSLPLLQANFYSTLIEGRIYEEQLEQYLKDYQIQFEAPVFGLHRDSYIDQSGAGRNESATVSNFS